MTKKIQVENLGERAKKDMTLIEDRGRLLKEQDGKRKERKRLEETITRETG